MGIHLPLPHMICQPMFTNVRGRFEVLFSCERLFKVLTMKQGSHVFEIAQVLAQRVEIIWKKASIQWRTVGSKFGEAAM